MDNYINNLIKKFIKEKGIKRKETRYNNNVSKLEIFNDNGDLLKSLTEHDDGTIIDSMNNTYDEYGRIIKTVRLYNSGNISINELTNYIYYNDSDQLKSREAYINNKLKDYINYDNNGNVVKQLLPNCQLLKYINYRDCNKLFEMKKYNNMNELIEIQHVDSRYKFIKQNYHISLEQIQSICPMMGNIPEQLKGDLYKYTINITENGRDDSLSVLSNDEIQPKSLINMLNDLLRPNNINLYKLKNIHGMYLFELIKTEKKDNVIVTKSLLDNGETIQINNDKGEPLAITSSSGKYCVYEYDEDGYIGIYKDNDRLITRGRMSYASGCSIISNDSKDDTVEELYINNENDSISYKLIKNGKIMETSIANKFWEE